MVGWHHRCDGREFEQALRVGDGQGSLECCSPWGCIELDTNEAIELTYTHHKYLLLQSEAVYKIISSVQLLSCV